MSRSQWSAAADLWSAISQQDPADAEAMKGLMDAQSAMNQATRVERVVNDDAVMRQQAQEDFNDSLIRAGNQFDRGDFAGADKTVNAAKMALSRDKQYLSPADFDDRMARAQTELVRISVAKTASAEASKRASDSANKQETTQQKDMAQEKRQMTINESMMRVRQLQSELKYKEALEVVEEILFIDPTNPSALAMRDVLQSGLLYRRYSDLQKQRSYAFADFSQDAQASFVPPKISVSGPGPKSLDGEMAYPEDWPALSLRREGQYPAPGFHESAEDLKVMGALKQKVKPSYPELPLEAVLKTIETELDVPMYVDWNSLKKAEPEDTITRDSTVKVELASSVSWATVLDMVLRSLEGEEPATDREGAANRPDWMVDGGMIVVASAYELALRRTTIVYDVRDLLYQVPYFDNAPDFSVDAALNQGGGQGGGGGGGGGSGGGGFGGGGGGGGGGGSGGGRSLFGSGGDPDLPTAEQRAQTLQRMIDLIKSMVPEAMWDAQSGPMGESKIDNFNGNLVITATPKSHREIMNLLTQLRAVRAIQINIESRLIAVEVQWFEQIGLDFDLYFNTNPNLFDAAVDQDPNFQLRDFFFQNTAGRNGRLKNPVTFGGLGQAGAANGINTTATGSALGVPGAGSTIDYTQTGIYEPLGVRRNGVNYPGGGASNGISPVNVQQEGLPLIQLLGAGLKGTVAASALANPALSVGFTYLDDVQVDLLVQATQADQRAMTLTAPRLTLFNGSRSWISFGGSQAYVANVQAETGDSSGAFTPIVQNLRTGFVLDIEAVASSDRRYVSMTVMFAQNILIGFDQQEVQGAAGGGDFGRSSTFNATIQLPNIAVTQINTAVSCPDKGTILLGGRRDVNETEIEVGVPVLSKVPFVNRFFTNSVTSKLETTTLLLIRPEIIIQQEAEDLLFPGLGDQLQGVGGGSRF